LLEPAVLGLPLLSGPYTQNAQDAADLLAQAGALCIVQDADQLAARLLEWFSDPVQARAAGARGQEAVAASRGAVDRLVSMIDALLDP
jgi:3-deoxy-D-manno-octulosonic-acid transferase